MVILLALPTTSSAWGGLDGDSELIHALLAARKQNHGNVRTWQGKAEETRRVVLPGTGLQITTEVYEFTLDVPNDALLWRRHVTRVQQGAEGVPGLPWTNQQQDVPDMRWSESLMRTRDGIYNLLPVTRHEDGRIENALLIYPAGTAKIHIALQNKFDPMTYLLTWEGDDLDKMLTNALKYSSDPNDSGQYGVTRKGQLITVRLDLNKTTWNYTFDLARGGNLIAAESFGQGIHNRYAWEYIQVDGVWIPSVYKRTLSVDSQSGTDSVKEIRFTGSVLNKELSVLAFSMEAMGVHQGCHVQDNRNHRVYSYDGGSNDRLQDWPMEAFASLAVTEFSSPLVMDMPDGPAPAERGRRVWLYTAGAAGLALAVAFAVLRARSRKFREHEERA